MGDVLLTTPVVRLLRNKYPDARIDFVTSKPFAEVYKYNPYINELIEYDKSLPESKILKIRNKLLEKNGGKYDVFIDLQKNFRSKIFRKNISKKILEVEKNRLRKLSLVYLKKQLFGKIPQIPQQYIRALEPLSLEDDGNGLELWFPEERQKGFYPPEQGILPQKGKIKIAVAPGAHHKTKQYPVELFSAALNKINQIIKPEFIIIGGIQDNETTADLTARLPYQITDGTGSTSIIDTARKINGCHMLLTNDTGVMHIAAARQVPIVALFGSTVTDFGFAPFRVKNKILEANVKCRPCSHIGRDKCPKDHFDCMKQISPAKVANAVIETVLI